MADLRIVMINRENIPPAFYDEKIASQDSSNWLADNGRVYQYIEENGNPVVRMGDNRVTTDRTFYTFSDAIIVMGKTTEDRQDGSTRTLSEFYKRYDNENKLALELRLLNNPEYLYSPTQKELIKKLLKDIR